MAKNELNPISGFVEQNNLYLIGDFIYPRSAVSPDYSFRQPIVPNESHFRFIVDPLNPGNSELLSTPDFLNNYFAQSNFQVLTPIPLINRGGSTLFTCAGVQVLDNVIHDEIAIPSKPVYIAQPGLRTQFIDSIGEGTSTSFINISTCQVNINQQDHFKHLQTWIDLFKLLGLEESNLYFKTKPYEQQWGDKVVKSEKIFVVYDGLEIGDASFMSDIPQKTRPNISLSDIGFGLERIKWILQGGSYSDVLGEGRISKDLDPITVACSHTLSLLAGEGLKPSNKEHGYRFRLFSKKLVNQTLGAHTLSTNQVRSYFEYWEKWMTLSTTEDEAIKLISTENMRNFNRILIDKLSEKFPDVGLDINQTTPVLIKRLKGTSVDPEYLTNVLEELKYNHD